LSANIFTTPGETALFLILGSFILQIFFTFVAGAMYTVSKSNDILKDDHVKIVRQAIAAQLTNRFFVVSSLLQPFLDLQFI
jgi:hypothetical protein